MDGGLGFGGFCQHCILGVGHGVNHVTHQVPDRHTGYLGPFGIGELELQGGPA